MLPSGKYEEYAEKIENPSECMQEIDPSGSICSNIPKLKQIKKDSFFLNLWYEVYILLWRN